MNSDVVLIAITGGLGSVLRFVVDGAINARLGTRHPWGTFAVNVTGSFALGWVTGLATAWGPGWVTLVGVGFLGGYTTFSTASWEAVTLLRDRRWGSALMHTVGMLVACVAAAAAGLALT